MNRQDKEFPFDRQLTKFARENRKSGNPAEVRIWKLILSNREVMPNKWTRQKPALHYILDFYCAGLRMAIEIDGESHNEKELYDLKRTELLKTLSIKVIRYINHDVLFNIEGIYEDVILKMKDREKELGLCSKFNASLG